MLIYIPILHIILDVLSLILKLTRVWKQRISDWAHLIFSIKGVVSSTPHVSHHLVNEIYSIYQTRSGCEDLPITDNCEKQLASNPCFNSDLVVTICDETFLASPPTRLSLLTILVPFKKTSW